MNIIAQKENFYFLKNHHEEDESNNEFLCHYLDNLFYHRYMIVSYQLFNSQIKRRRNNEKNSES